MITCSVQDSDKFQFSKLIRLSQVDQWLLVRREKELVQQHETPPSPVRLRTGGRLLVARVSAL